MHKGIILFTVVVCFFMTGLVFAWIPDSGQTTLLSKRKGEKEIPQLKRLMPKPAIDHIIESVSHEFGCGKEDVLRRGKKNNLARDSAIYIARSSSGITTSPVTF